MSKLIHSLGKTVVFSGFLHDASKGQVMEVKEAAVPLIDLLAQLSLARQQVQVFSNVISSIEASLANLEVREREVSEDAEIPDDDFDGPVEDGQG